VQLHIGESLRKATRNAFAQLYERAVLIESGDFSTSPDRLLVDWVCRLSILQAQDRYPTLGFGNLTFTLRFQMIVSRPDGTVVCSRGVETRVEWPQGDTAKGEPLAPAANKAIVDGLKFLIGELRQSSEVSAYARELQSGNNAVAFLGWLGPESLDSMASVLTGIGRGAIQNAGSPTASLSDIEQAMKNGATSLAKLTEDPVALSSLARSIRCCFLIFGKIEPEGEQVRLTAFIFDRKTQSVINSMTRKERMDDIPTLQEAVRTMVAELNRSRSLPQRQSN
jgi:hypothetical protein